MLAGLEVPVKKLAMLILLFCIVGVLIDRAGERCLKVLYDRAVYSFDRSETNFHAVAFARPDVIVLGDSRAQQHYDVSLLAKATGLSFYNCGASGHGIMHMLLGMQYLEPRYRPKYVLIDINVTQFQIFYDRYLEELWFFAPDSDKLLAYTKILGPYCRYVHSKKLAILFKRCRCFRYNGKMLTILTGCLGSNSHLDPALGFRPVAYPPQSAWGSRGFYSATYDQHQFIYLIELLKLLKKDHIRPMLCIGPHYVSDPNFKAYPVELETIIGIKQIAKEMHVPLILIDTPNYRVFTQRSLFGNEDHLNTTGAHVFSDILAKHLRLIISHAGSPDFNKSPYSPRLAPRLYILPKQYF